MGSIRRVMLVVAMQEEAAPMIAGMQLQPNEKHLENLPAVIHDGERDGAYVAVVTPGLCSKFGVNLVGTDAAAMTTFLAARELKPDLIITAGTCGGFKRTGGAIGDVFSITSFQHHDRRIPIPGYEALGLAKRDATPTCVLLS